VYLSLVILTYMCHGVRFRECKVQLNCLYVLTVCGISAGNIETNAKVFG